jgi:hypothetical protein
MLQSSSILASHLCQAKVDMQHISNPKHSTLLATDALLSFGKKAKK